MLWYLRLSTGRLCMVLGYDKLKRTVGHTQHRAKHYREILGRAQFRHWHHLRDGRESQIWP